eukprot:m.8964 g.8964  ORF g.8964 m.8964 type:complete len:70 (+) comp11529_c0_seq1:670-879(+)
MSFNLSKACFPDKWHAVLQQFLKRRLDFPKVFHECTQPASHSKESAMLCDRASSPSLIMATILLLWTPR